jgi:AcrR family transcriptional regulator
MYEVQIYTQYMNVQGPIPSDRRSRKRLATRQGISTAATRLFFKRGFDHVTVDEIAAAADVGRMTVFNHFPRKEDMFFDRDGEAREILRKTLRQRDPRVAPIETLRLLAHRLAAEQSPFVRFTAASRGYIETIEGSETLKARARAIRDELAQVVAVALSECVGENLPIRSRSSRPVCSWRRGPWPSSRPTRPFDSVEQRRKRKPPFWLLLIREPSA